MPMEREVTLGQVGVELLTRSHDSHPPVSNTCSNTCASGLGASYKLAAVGNLKQPVLPLPSRPPNPRRSAALSCMSRISHTLH
jgi:hypothetical protein